LAISKTHSDRARIVFDCRTANDPAMMSSTRPKEQVGLSHSRFPIMSTNKYKIAAQAAHTSTIRKISVNIKITVITPLASPEGKAAGDSHPRRSLVQGTTNKAPCHSYAGGQEICLIDENTQSGRRMIV
jgi:hypothetical protein